MGLLDGIQNMIGTSFDDPRTMGLLSIAESLRSSPSLMGGMNRGLLGYQGAVADGKRAKEAEQARAMQMQMQQMALQQAQRQAAMQQQQDQFRQSIPSPQMQAAQVGLAGGGGPSPANAARMPAVDPMAQFYHGAMQSGLMDPMQYQAAIRKDNSPLKLGAGEGLYDPKTFKPLVVNPKEDSTPSALKEYQFAKQQGYPGSFLDFQIAQKRAGATNVSVPINTGQKGLDNTLKLRGDFRSEPVYKAHQEMQSAYAQIQQSLKQASPAGDLAGATKLMKLLDPGSVVRESELGMAMAASGLLDRVQNYAGNIISGNKLTPTQRKDFQTLADALYQESIKQYNGKRSEYHGIAQRNELNVQDVLGNEASGGSTSIDALLLKYGGK